MSSRPYERSRTWIFRLAGLPKVRPLVALLAGLLAVGGATAQPRFGALTGLIVDATNKPVGGATVTAAQQDGSAIRATISGSDGVYSFADMVPGTYSVIARVPGHPGVTIPSVQVTAGEGARADVTVGPSTAPLPVAAPATETAVGNAQPAPAHALSQLPLHASMSAPALSTFPSRPSPASGPLAAGAPPGGLAPANGPKPETAPDPSIPQAAQAASAPPAPPAPQTAPAAPAVDTVTPFADTDWTWLNGISRQHDTPLDTKYFSPEFRADTFFGEDFNQPKDHSMGGSSEVFRNGEVQLEDLSIGGDFHAGNMRGRVLALFGMFSATTVRNDASPAVGQWDVRAAYKYVSEAYGGYHFDVNHGINIDAGIFVSYVGLFSYHNFDNWAYQPSYVSSNTPWFFNGVRIQWFPTNHLKIEPWFINGWQSYNKYNSHPGLGGQLKWTPKPWMNVIANQYGFGEDNVGLPRRTRYHTDDSIEIKYYDKPKVGNGIDKIAFTFTGDLGCETGNGVSCAGDHPYDAVTGKGGPKQSFVGYMLYNRWWWHKDLLAATLGGGQINNPGRYLTLVLPINGADAISGTPYFPAYPGAPFKAYDGTATLDWMPSQFTTFRLEFGYRHANVPYWSGRDGITPPGGNNGYPADFVCNDGTPSVTLTGCGNDGGLWRPDLRKGQALLSLSIMVKL
ncbi:MAG: outer membrane beta-barrel protein [Bryobacteraceae bacterium]